MKSEQEIRKRRDQLRKVIALPDPDFDDKEQQDQYKGMLVFIQSHEMLLTWVLEGHPAVEKSFDKIKGLEELT